MSGEGNGSTEHLREGSVQGMYSQLHKPSPPPPKLTVLGQILQHCRFQGRMDALDVRIVALEPPQR